MLFLGEPNPLQFSDRIVPGIFDLTQAQSLSGLGYELCVYFSRLSAEWSNAASSGAQSRGDWR